MAALLMAFGAWGGYRWSYPSTLFNYRLTVEVSVEGATISGSSVGMLGAGLSPRWLGSSSSGWNGLVQGEAVEVDLGSRGRLWVLLTRKGADSLDFLGNLVWHAFERRGLVTREDDRYRTGLGFRRYWATVTAYREPIVLDESEYPIFVRFRDEADPKSVELVDPADLAKSFGGGVWLRRVTFSMTDDPVTTRIAMKLKWLGSYPEPSLQPSRDPMQAPLSATIHHGDFRRG